MDWWRRRPGRGFLWLEGDDGDDVHGCDVMYHDGLDVKVDDCVCYGEIMSKPQQNLNDTRKPLFPPSHHQLIPFAITTTLKPLFLHLHYPQNIPVS